MTGIANIETSEIIADMTPDEARGLTDRIRSSASGVWTMLLRARQEGAWRALGYKGWNEYLDTEFRGVKLALPREERRAVLESYSEAGMSQREIAAATGLSTGTVNAALNDERSEMNGTSDTFTPIEPKVRRDDVPDSDEVDSEEHSPGLPVESSLPTAEVDASLERSASTSATPPLTHEEQHELDLQAAAERDARRIRQVLDGWGSVEGLPNSPLRDRVDSLLIDHDRNAVYALLERVSA